MSADDWGLLIKDRDIFYFLFLNGKDKKYTASAYHKFIVSINFKSTVLKVLLSWNDHAKIR